jgi:hypothetical protein
MKIRMTHLKKLKICNCYICTRESFFHPIVRKMSAIVLTANTYELSCAMDIINRHEGSIAVNAKTLGNWRVMLERDADGKLWVRSYKDNQCMEARPYFPARI